MKGPRESGGLFRLGPASSGHISPAVPLGAGSQGRRDVPARGTMVVMFGISAEFSGTRSVAFRLRPILDYLSGNAVPAH